MSNIQRYRPRICFRTKAKKNITNKNNNKMNKTKTEKTKKQKQLLGVVKGSYSKMVFTAGLSIIYM
jgi:hypothetical protein